jgi:antitoxin (DNA-binding transcriptional repressor) of toxin-antitoxin stability system
MKVVGITGLKKELSAYVRAAAAGEAVLVTIRDQVVAELGPPRQQHRVARTDDDVIARGVREGWLQRASTGVGVVPARSRHSIAPSHVVAGLDRDRAERT